MHEIHQSIESWLRESVACLVAFCASSATWKFQLNPYNASTLRFSQLAASPLVMAFAACARRNLALSIHSIPGSSTRARVPRYFAAPQSRLRTTPTHFSTLSALRLANDATSEANHASTTGDATKPKDEISEAAAPTTTADDIDEPSHEASSQTDPQADAEPSLGELQEDLGLEQERDVSLDERLFLLTGRRPGRMLKRIGQNKVTEEQKEKNDRREDLIAKLAMGQIEEGEAADELKKLEPRNSKNKAEKKTRKDQQPKTSKVSTKDRDWSDEVAWWGSANGDKPRLKKREDNKPALKKREGDKPAWSASAWPAWVSGKGEPARGREAYKEERDSRRESNNPAWGREPYKQKRDSRESNKSGWTSRGERLGRNDAEKPAWTTRRPLGRNNTDKPERNYQQKEGEWSGRRTAEAARGKGDKPARYPWNNDADKPEWKKYKESLEKKFEGASWRPAKRVSPDAVLGMRDLHKSDPNTYNIEVLSDQFKISKEAVRRILKSKFTPNQDEMKDKRDRWERRGEAVWKKLSDTGVRPPKKWREMGVSQGPAPWKKGKGNRRPKEEGYAWDEEPSRGSSFVGRIE